MFASKDLFLTRPSGYQISRSVRLRSSASAYFNRTPASASNQTTWTLSMWVKRGLLSSTLGLFNAGATATTAGFVEIDLQSDNTLIFYSQLVGTNVFVTTQVFRDPSSWYHLVFSVDTTQATASNRVKLYVNGVQVTSFSSTSYPAQNSSTAVNSTGRHVIGSSNTSGGGLTSYFDGYLTEINFIDGQALTPSSFGSTNTVTGVWQPIKYTGTYGTNGFYLNFSDNSNNTATTIGKDYSGNGNNWTPNNISITAGTTYDSMLDVPTLYADGGNGRGNYAVMNPLSLGSTVTLSNANLTMTEVGTYATTVSSIAMTSGKWYAEMTVGSNTYAGTVGIAKLGYASTSRLGFQANTWSYNNDGGLYYNSSTLAVVSSYTTNDVIGIAFDVDNLTITFYKNNVQQGTQYTAANSGLTAGEFYFATGHINSTSNWNFGQRPFTYTPPSGYSALNTQNLPTPTISNGATVMAASTYTGTGATQTIANSGNNAASISFKPDLVWIKSRSAATNNNLFDSVRGTTNYLISNSTAAEATNANTLTAFGTTGFTLGSDASAIGVNVNAATYVAWQWQAGQGSTSSNTSGSITSTVSVNATAGFSVVTYTGNGSAGATFGHGLGVTPAMIIIKARTATSAENWFVYQQKLTAVTYYLRLNSTNAQTDGGSSGATSRVTAISSSVITLGPNAEVNENTKTYVAYCFAAVAGYSAFGSYTGNGSADGPFIYTGFRPRWVMIKRTDSAGFDWNIVDTSRNTYNVTTSRLWADLSNAEDSTDNVCDITSNGFKLRSTNTNTNASGGTYIYMAVAENPFKISLAR